MRSIYNQLDLALNFIDDFYFEESVKDGLFIDYGNFKIKFYYMIG